MLLPEWNEWVEMIVDNWIKTGRSETQLAKDIGINQATLNSWKNNTRGKPRDPQIVSVLIEYFKDSNPEIYDLLNSPRPVDFREVLLEKGFPEDFVDNLVIAREEYTTELSRSGISTDSPEAREIIKTVLSKHGIHITDTEQ